MRNRSRLFSDTHSKQKIKRVILNCTTRPSVYSNSLPYFFKTSDVPWLSHVALERLGDLFLGDRADDLLNHLAILEN